MQFQLKTEDLIKIDQEIFAFNKVYGLALNSLDRLPNIIVTEKITNQIGEIKLKLRAVETEDKFEKLFVENSLLNMEVQRAYLEYFSTRSKENIDELSELCFGKEGLSDLKEMIKDFDYEAHWEYYLTYQEHIYKLLPADDFELQSKFKDILNRLKVDILEYAQKHFGLSEGYDFDLCLGQPYSQRTYFHPTNRRVEIAPRDFMAYKDNGDIKIETTTAIRNLFHEFVGHALHEHNSQNMPKSIQDNSSNISNPITNVQSEGIAQHAEKHAIKFMKEYAKEYNIEEDFIKQREIELTLGTNAFWAYYQYLRLKNLEDSTFDEEKEFLEITNNFGLSLLYKFSQQAPFSFIRDTGYPLGYEYLSNILNDLKKKLGKEEFVKKEKIINKAISTGLWHYKVLPRFVELYLEENKE